MKEETVFGHVSILAEARLQKPWRSVHGPMVTSVQINATCSSTERDRVATGLRQPLKAVCRSKAGNDMGKTGK